MARSLHHALRRLPLARRVAMAARFGSVTRTSPLTEWGEQRGTPVDRWYIERYLAEHRGAVSGRVLEVKADHYGSWLGASSVEVVDIDAANSRAAVVGDLCEAATLRVGRYDAAIVTQTLQLVGDPTAAVRNVLASLRPGGAMLLTVPCLSRLCGPGDLWRWTPAGVRRLLLDAAPDAPVVDVRGLGNGLAARAFLFGLAAEDLPAQALEAADSEQPLLVGAVVRVPA